MVQLSHPHMTTGRTIALTIWTFVGKVSLPFNTLSRFVIAFLPRSKHPLISLQSPSAVILEPPQNKVWHCFHCFPIYFPWSDGNRCHMSLGSCKLKRQWDSTTHLLPWPKPKQLRTLKAGEDLEQWEISFVAGWNEKWYSHFGRQFGNVLQN